MANYITASRILLIFPIIYFITNENSLSNLIALVMFVIAGITDHLDGYVARKTSTVSSLGGLLDLIADKLLICVPLIYLLSSYDNESILIPALIIISRELVIASFRQFLTESLGSNPIKVSFVAKTKTTVQIIALSFLIISPNYGDFFYSTAIILLWIAAYISLHSLYEYIKVYKNLIK